MTELIGALLLVLGIAMLGGRQLATVSTPLLNWARRYAEVLFAIGLLVAGSMILLASYSARALPGEVGWRDNFPRLHEPYRSNPQRGETTP